MTKILAALLVGLFFAAGSEHSLAQNIEQLIDAYPGVIATDPNDNNAIVFVKDGTRMVFDDGLQKSPDAILESADLEDQIKEPYPAGPQYQVCDGCDPGRARNETFFKKMYGSTKAEVGAKLTHIVWLPKSIGVRLSVTKVNGVDKRLQEISNELDALVQSSEGKKFLKYLQNPAGTFLWRTIDGTDRLSAHSFGIAIDIGTKYSDYWRWSPRYRNQIPFEIVAIFEKHGFIWGGKWVHFDTMHFEYRPELLRGVALQ